MSSLYKRNNTWYVKVAVAPRQYRRITTGTPHEAEARIAQRRIDAQYSYRLTLEGLYTWYKANAPAELSPLTIRKNLDTISTLIRHIGNKPVADLTRTDLEHFKRRRLNEEWKKDKRITAATVNCELRALRSVSSYAIGLGIPVPSPSPAHSVRLLPADAAEAPYLTPEQAKALIVAIDKPWLRQITILALLTGMRPGEVVNLTWQQIDMEQGIVTIRRTERWRPKKDKIRSIPLHPLARAILQQCRATGTDQRVFPYSRSYVSHRIKKAYRSVNLSERVNFKSLRHTFATWLLQNGAHSYDVGRLLGHKDEYLVNTVYGHHQAHSMQHTINILPLKGIAA